MRRLSYRQVLELVAGKPIDELILVGGQATNAWAEAFGMANENEEGVYGAALSGDIDFLGLQPAAIKLAKALGARVEVATLDDSTPHAAYVTLDIDGEKQTIDVLHSLLGISTDELREVREWAAVPEMPGAIESKLRVMHPLHCLQSQLENVYGSLNRRDGPDGTRVARRIALLNEISRRTLQHYLDHDKVASAQRMIEKLYELARARSAMRAWRLDGIDFVAGLPREGKLGADFVDKRLPQLERHLDKKRASDERRRRNMSR